MRVHVRRTVSDRIEVCLFLGKLGRVPFKYLYLTDEEARALAFKLLATLTIRANNTSPSASTVSEQGRERH